MGGPGPIGKVMGWIGGFTTHGISETHVAHHVASKIPHYHAWEAANALRGVLRERGYDMDGGYATWGEVMRVYKACKVGFLPSARDLERLSDCCFLVCRR
jgi:omega-6 fatty acid desaturase (delta-12 desaturase)